MREINRLADALANGVDRRVASIIRLCMPTGARRAFLIRDVVAAAMMGMCLLWGSVALALNIAVSRRNPLPASA